MEYRLCRNNLYQLLEFGFQIRWTTVKIGYYGYHFIPPQLTMGEICEFTAEEMMNKDCNDLVARLACAEGDKCEFEEVLNRLVKGEDVSASIQLRKWRVLLLFRQLKKLSDDYTEGLVQLTEFWLSLGLPDDCPHIVQGRNNCLSPNQYYTKEVYTALKKKNENWLESEIADIIASEKEI